MRDIRIEVLEEFADAAQHRPLHDTLDSPHAQGLEGARRAWRARQAQRGLCSWCTAPATQATLAHRYPMCPKHHEQTKARALKRHYANRSQLLQYFRDRRLRLKLEGK